MDPTAGHSGVEAEGGDDGFKETPDGCAAERVLAAAALVEACRPSASKVMPAQGVRDLPGGKLQGDALEMRRLQAQRFLEHTQRALGYSLDGDNELPVTYPPLESGFYALLVIPAAVVSVFFCALAEDFCQGVFHGDLEVHRHATKQGAQMWNQRPQGVEETARILHKRLSAGEGKRPSGPGPAMYSVKSHGLPGNKRGTQDIQEGDYPLKITFCGSSVLEPAFIASTLQGITTHVQQGVHVMMTLQEASGERDVNQQACHRLVLSFVGDKEQVRSARIYFEDLGIKQGLSVAVDRRPPAGFVAGLRPSEHK